MINHKLKYVFIHIPKCAGISVKTAIGINYMNVEPAEAHFPACVLRLSPVWNNYFKFTFVRNTWDRWLSIYTYNQKENPNIISEGFEVWMKRVFANSQNPPRLSQMFWICNTWLKDGGTKHDMDFIGRFENLEKDFQFICNKLKIKSQLPHVNSTNHRHYSTYYSDSLIDLVAEKCAVEIKYFGFTFKRKSKTFL